MSDNIQPESTEKSQMPLTSEEKRVLNEVLNRAMGDLDFYKRLVKNPFGELVAAGLSPETIASLAKITADFFPPPPAPYIPPPPPLYGPPENFRSK